MTLTLKTSRKKIAQAITNSLTYEDGELLVSNILTFDPMVETESELTDIFGEDSIENVGVEDDAQSLSNDVANLDLLEDENIRETNELIVLPPQMRCMSHLLNLVSADFQKALSPQANSALVCALNQGLKFHFSKTTEFFRSLQITPFFRHQEIFLVLS